MILQENDLTANEKRAGLERIVRSAVLQNARQLQRILEFVGERAIAGDPAEVNEFTLAAEVFGRSQDFDPGADTTVRSSVYRLRSKLRDYYAGEGRLDPIRIEIPKGHYSPSFTRRGADGLAAASSLEMVPLSQPAPAASATPSPTLVVPPLRRHRWPWVVALIAGVSALIFAALHFAVGARQSAADLFWAPFLSSAKPTLIYTGTNVVYRLPRDVANRYAEERNIHNHGLEYPFQLDPEQARHLQADAVTFITKQDSFAAAAITSLFSRHAAAFGLRYGPDVSFGDLRSGPAILIGAFNNSWTLEMTNELRFVFDHGDTIREQAPGGRVWSVRAGDDWALISRVLSSKTGASLLGIAGIGAIGTQAAGEFVTDPRRLNDLLKSAPANWSRRNMQVVLHTRVIDDMPGSSEVVAAYFW